MFNFDAKTQVTDAQIAKTLRSEALAAAVTTALDHVATVDGIIINGQHIVLTEDRRNRARDMVISGFFPNADDPNREAAREYYSTRLAELAESESSTEPKGVDLTKYPSKGVSLAKD